MYVQNANVTALYVPGTVSFVPVAALYHPLANVRPDTVEPEVPSFDTKLLFLAPNLPQGCISEQFLKFRMGAVEPYDVPSR